MTDNDPDSSDADKGIDNFSENGRRNPVVDHKSEECPGQHGDDTGADHRQVRHVEPAEEKTDQKNYYIVYTEECLDRCQVFLFALGGGKQVKRCSGTARREQAVTDAADDAQNSSGDRAGRDVNPVGKNEEEDGNRHEHDAQEQVHDIRADLGREEVYDSADDGGRNQEREHDSPLNGVSVFEGNIEC